MKQGIIALTAALVAAATVPACQAPKVPTTDTEKYSYGIGVKVAESLVTAKFQAKPELVARGVKDATSGSKTLLSDTESQDAIRTYAMTHQGGANPEDKPDPKSELKTLLEKFSYSVGMSVASKLKSQSVVLDVDMFCRGFEDKFGGKKAALSDADITTALNKLTADVQGRMIKQMQEQAAKNEKEGAAFLAKNKLNKGVVTLPSGLQYTIVKAGTGPKPKATDTVVCKYRGTLIDGTLFDESAKHGGTVEFMVQGVIPGWTEALKLMPTGSKWKLFIPGKLAYGLNPPPGGAIGPNSTLLFDIELVSIKKGQAGPPKVRK